MALSVGMNFVFKFKNAVSINFYIQMESNQDSTALAQQVQALVATVEELTKQYKKMKLQLQQDENRSKGNLEIKEIVIGGVTAKVLLLQMNRI